MWKICIWHQYAGENMFWVQRHLILILGRIACSVRRHFVLTNVVCQGRRTSAIKGWDETKWLRALVLVALQWGHGWGNLCQGNLCKLSSCWLVGLYLNSAVLRYLAEWPTADWFLSRMLSSLQTWWMDLKYLRNLPKGWCCSGSVGARFNLVQCLGCQFDSWGRIEGENSVLT